MVYTLWRVKHGASVAEGLEIRRIWSAGFVRRLGFHIEWEGNIPDHDTCLYVGNHRCSVDPQAVMARLKAYPVSRAEVRKWPFVGKGSEATGIIFVDKSNKESRLRAKTALLEELRKGHSVLIFPEGQTNVKNLTSTFHKGSFEQAAAGMFPVVPFAIEYEDTRDYWDHSDNFASHLIKRFGKKRTNVKICFGPKIVSDNPWTLLRSAQTWIDEKIAEIRTQWGDNET
jgi:1-acyl-sn-glycerol-3-phosphate acyltransferase